MGVTERRQRERRQRRRSILDAAWRIAEEVGWGAFSLRRVAAEAELGRATVYGYFSSVDDLVAAMAADGLDMLERAFDSARTKPETLVLPIEFARNHPAAYELLFPRSRDPRSAFSSEELSRARSEARRVIAAREDSGSVEVAPRSAAVAD